MKSVSNRTFYIIVIAIIVIGFILFGGGFWINGMMHKSMFIGIANWNWPQILLCIGIGFLLGWFVAKKRR